MSDEIPQAIPEEVPATIDESSIKPNPVRKNSIADHLKHRPARSDLIDKNIIPAVFGQEMEAKKQMVADKLNEQIAHRPTPDQLLQDGVLHEDPRSPEDRHAAEERYLEAMEDEYAKREGGA